MWGKTILFVSLAMTSLSGIRSTAVLSADESPKALVTGRALRETLQLRRSLAGQGESIREMLRSFQRDTGIAVVLDRRIDPGYSPKISTEYVTAEEVLRQLTRTLSDSDVSIGDRYVYIGPDTSASRLRTLTEIHRRRVKSLQDASSAETLRNLNQAASVQWEDLAEPRQILLDAAGRVGVQIINSGSIPHDLWAEQSLPPLTFGDLAVLILNQFELSVRWTDDGHTMEVVPLTEPVVIEQTHRVSSRRKEQVVDRWQEAFPSLTIQWNRTQATVAATVEQHELLAKLIKGPVSAMPAADVAAASLPRRMFALKLPPGTTYAQLIDYFQSRGIPIRLEGIDSDRAKLRLSEVIRHEIPDAPGDEFFPALFQPLKVRVKVHSDYVSLLFDQ